MLKAELRKNQLAKQRKLTPEERLEKNRHIAGLFFSHFDLSEINFLHCFLPIQKNGEIDTWQIFQRVWREFPHITTAVPRINAEKTRLESIQLTAETKLVFNWWGILEPPPEAPPVEAWKIDAVLVPLLAFDERGYRVGYGKGYYDKFLGGECRRDAAKIGLSYFPSVEEISDVHEFDVKLDFCVTPDRLWKF